MHEDQCKGGHTDISTPFIQLTSLVHIKLCVFYTLVAIEGFPQQLIDQLANVHDYSKIVSSWRSSPAVGHDRPMGATSAAEEHNRPMSASAASSGARSPPHQRHLDGRRQTAYQ